MVPYLLDRTIRPPKVFTTTELRDHIDKNSPKKSEVNLIENERQAQLERHQKKKSKDVRLSKRAKKPPKAAGMSQPFQLKF